MSTPTLRRDHYCTQSQGLNTECGNDAYTTEDGQWLCPSHASFARTLAKWDRDLQEFERTHPDWDLEPDGIVEPPADVLEQMAQERYETAFAEWCDDNDIAPNHRDQSWAREAYDDYLVGLAEASES